MRNKLEPWTLQHNLSTSDDLVNIYNKYLEICPLSICPCFANDIWNKSYMNCGNEMKVKKWSSQWTQFMQLRKEAWKNFRTGAIVYQLSYEATDVGSRSVVGSYVPVKEMSVNDIWNKSYMNCGNEMKMKKWSSQWMQFMQLRKRSLKKLQDFNLVWTRDLIFFQASLRNCINCEVSGSNGHGFKPRWSPEFFSLRNFINCVHCEDHFFRK